MSAAAPPAPEITALIPVYNEVRAIDACLSSILGQDLAGRSMEVLVVSGRSDDGTDERLAEWQTKDDRVRVLSLPGTRVRQRFHLGARSAPRRFVSRVSQKLNLGLRSARGRIVVRMDAHTQYAPDYIRSSVELLERSGADAVGGIQLPLPGAPTATGRAIAALQATRLGLGGGAHRQAGYEGPARTLWLGTLRRDTAVRIGGFDEALFRSEDNDFYQRLGAAGGRLLVSASIRAHYVCRPTLTALANQQLVTGREIPPTLRRNPRAFGVRHLVPGGATALGLVLVLAALLVPSWRGALLATLGILGSIYAALVLANGVAIARRAGTETFLPAVAGTVVVHLAYGLGTLIGLPGLLLGHRRGPRPRPGMVAAAGSDAPVRPSV